MGEAVHWLYHWLQRWDQSLGEQGETGRQDRSVKSRAIEITQVLPCPARGAALPKGGISCQLWSEV